MVEETEEGCLGQLMACGSIMSSAPQLAAYGCDMQGLTALFNLASVAA